MKSSVVACFLLAASLLAPHSCRSEALPSSRFNVLRPQSLYKAGGYDHTDAMFGNPPYGESIQQRLYYANNNTMCYFVAEQLDTAHWLAPFIMMIDRGDWSFVQKVRNGQKAGASAVLIADDICLCDREVCQDEETNGQDVYCQSEVPMMADDGTGSDVSIPSFLLLKEDADPIRNALLNEKHVVVEMSFSVPAPDNRVEYELWTNPADSYTRKLHEDFHSAVQALQDHASFTPQMYIEDGEHAGCHGDDGTDFCGDLCTNHGRYCSVEVDLNSGATGQEVVNEALRRICVWNLYGKDNGIGLPWWEYVKHFTELCDSESVVSGGKVFSDEACVKQAMELAGVDKDMVDECMEKSGGTTEDQPNQLLEKALADQRAADVGHIPLLVVNQAVIRGSLNFDTTFRAICAGFAAGSVPPICLECATSQDKKTCVEHSSGAYQTNGFLGINTRNTGVAICTVVVVMVLLMVFFALDRRQKAFMRQQSQSEEDDLDVTLELS